MIVVDTHVLLWALADHRRLGRRAQRLMARSELRYVSAVTHVELAIKGDLINLRAPTDLTRVAAEAGFVPLPLEERHAAAVNRFPQLARHDPFDRMLVAQADVDGLTLLTADRTLLALDQPWIIDATV